ncbi:MAG: hypothetical protein IJP02_02445 [Oscillospiraceae bacterium]|nr:hypothetical protein [Oscillospiraceae bacterium]
MKKRFLSILLAACMVMSLVPVTAMAVGETTPQAKVLWEDDFQDYEPGNFYDGTNKHAKAVEKGYSLVNASGTPAVNVVAEDSSKLLQITAARPFIQICDPGTDYTVAFDVRRDAAASGLFEVWLATQTEDAGNTYRLRIFENGAVAVYDTKTSKNFYVQTDGTLRQAGEIWQGGREDAASWLMAKGTWYRVALTVDLGGTSIGLKITERDDTSKVVVDQVQTVPVAMESMRVRFDPQNFASTTPAVSLDNILCTIPYHTVTAGTCTNGAVAVVGNPYATSLETVTLAALPEAGYRLDQFLVDGKAIVGNTFTTEKDVTVTATFVPAKTVFANDLEGFEEGTFHNTTAAKDAGFTFGGSGTSSIVVADGSKALQYTSARPYTYVGNPGAPYEISFDYKRTADANGLLSVWLGYNSSGSSIARFQLRENGSFGFNADGVSNTGGNLMFHEATRTHTTTGQYNDASRQDERNAIMAKDTWYTVHLSCDAETNVISATVYERDAASPVVYYGSLTCSDFEYRSINFDANAEGGSDPNYLVDNIRVIRTDISTYNITAEQAANGTVRVSADYAFPGDKVTATATPAAGYAVDSFTVNGTAIEGSVFTMPETNAVVTATFAPVSGLVSKVDTFESYEAGDFTKTIASDNGYSLYPDPATSIPTVAEAGGNKYLSFTSARPYLDLATARDSYALSFDVIRNAESSGLFELWVAEGSVPNTATEDPDDTKLVWIRFRIHENGAVGFVNTGSSINYWLTTASDFSSSGYNSSRTNEANLILAANTWYHVELAVDPEAGTYGMTIYERDSAGAVYSAVKTIEDFGLRAPRFDAQNFADADSAINVGIDNLTYAMPNMVPYAVTVAEAVNGTVTVSKESAYEGDTVTVTATPDEGYELTAIKVDGEAIEGTSFKMPAKAVEVTAEFTSTACTHPEANYVDVPAVGATCTVPGSTAGVKCGLCEAWVTEPEPIPAGHTYGELIEAQAEVHTQTALTAAVAAHYYCAACETYFTEAKEATTLEALTAAAPVHSYTNVNGYKGEDGHANTCSCGLVGTVSGHTAEVIPAVAPTESVPGWTAGEKCSVCDYVTVAPVEIPAVTVDQPIDVEVYKENNIAPTQTDHVFGGWYADAECTVPYTKGSGEAYAKFVDENVLRVKFQLSAGANAGSESVALRLVSTVDDLQYSKVGFKITVNGKTVEVSSTTVYSAITASEGGVAYDYDPTEFSAESAYFITFTITDIPSTAFGSAIAVVPYWVTLDGTVFEGIANSITISEHLPN